MSKGTKPMNNKNFFTGAASWTQTAPLFLLDFCYRQATIDTVSQKLDLAANFQLSEYSGIGYCENHGHRRHIKVFQFFMLAAFNDTLVSKVNIYEAAPTTTSVLNSIFSVFILLNAILIYKDAKYQDNFRLKFLFNLTAFTLYLSFLVVFILPSFYYFYSRIYTLGSLLLPLTFFFLTSQKKSLIYTGFLVANYVALSLTYFRIIFTYSEQYLPYTPWLFKDF